jgi:hypothetical protein
VAEGATERGRVMYVPSRNTDAECFQEREYLVPLQTFIKNNLSIIIIIILKIATCQTFNIKIKDPTS